MIVGRKSRRVNAGKRRTGMHPARIGFEATSDDRPEVAKEEVSREPISGTRFPGYQGKKQGISSIRGVGFAHRD
jgi:hypothetical protein